MRKGNKKTETETKKIERGLYFLQDSRTQLNHSGKPAARTINPPRPPPSSNQHSATTINHHPIRILTCLAAAINICLHHTSILKRDHEDYKYGFINAYALRMPWNFFFLQTWIHSVSLKGGQTTPEARITAPTAVSMQSKRVQLDTQELPACNHTHKTELDLRFKCQITTLYNIWAKAEIFCIERKYLKCINISLTL